MKTNLLRRNDLWNPNSLIEGLHRELVDVFDSGNFDTSRFTPHYELEETDGQYIFSFDLPGLKKEEISIEVNNNQLTVSGERVRKEREGKTSGFHRRMYGKFQQSFELPIAIDSQKVEASYQDGVLSITLPKSEEVRPKHIKIQ